MTAGQKLHRRIAEWLNPVLVKEVRAALRGRFFRFAFPIVVLAAVLIGAIVLIDAAGGSGNSIGRDFFMPMFVCLCIALFGIVPFSAFLSMGSEWDEHTYDLLVISDLKPRQIVLGKLLSAMVEGLLYFCAFAPMLVFTFLLRGIDITSVLLLIAGSVFASLSATAVALALSSVTRVRVVRVLLLAIVAGGGILLVAGAAELANDVLRGRGLFRSRASFDEFLGVFVTVVSVGLLGFTVACERLAHPEENHSTGPRVLVTFLLLVMLGSLAWIVLQGGPATNLHQPLIIVLILVAVMDIFFVTENETLTRRVRRMVPKSRLRAFLAVPFLPGGGRGIALFLVHVVLVLAAGTLIAGLGPKVWTPGTSGSDPTAFAFEGASRVVVFALYLFLYLAVPSVILARRSGEWRSRLIARILIPTLALLSIFLPALLGFLFGNRAWMRMEHPLNPFWVISPSPSTPIRGGAAVLLMLLVAAVVLLLNARRIVNGFAEVLGSSGERAARVNPSAAAVLPEERHVASGP